MAKKLKRYTDEFRSKFLADYQSSGKSLPVFSQEAGVAYSTAVTWINNQKALGNPIKGRSGPYSPEQRKQTIEAYQKSDMSQKDFAKTWGVPYKTLTGWLERYRKDGPKGLEGYAEPAEGDKRK